MTIHKPLARRPIHWRAGELHPDIHDTLARLIECHLAVDRKPSGSWSIEAVPYDIGSPTTAGLYRVIGDGWSVFVKVLQSFRRWPLFQFLEGTFGTDLPLDVAWRYELDVYRDGLASALPTGFRLPRLLAWADVGPDRAIMVLEDIAALPDRWDSHRFGHAARLLGRLNARLFRLDALPAAAPREPSRMTRVHYTSRVVPAVVPVLSSEETWRHPLLAGRSVTALRRDLTELARRLPAVLARLGRLPQVMGHGDASPQNLLVPVDTPDEFVVIDWTMGGSVAAGDDLGQLLVGMVHADELDVADLAHLRSVIADSYVLGLAEERRFVGERDVLAGMDGGLAVRSALTAVPFERLDEPITDALGAQFEQRLALTRYLVDLGLALEA